MKTLLSTLSLAVTVFLVSCAGVQPAVESGGTAAAPGKLRLVARGFLEPPSGSAGFDPGCVAVDARGRVLVADRSRGAVYVYDGPGPAIDVLADPPSGAGALGPRFQNVTSIVSTSGLNLYVLDAAPGRVYTYDLSNELRGTVLDLESPEVKSAFGRTRATALLIDRTGLPIVADREGDRLLVFSPQWEPGHAIGGPGLSGGGFRDPVALASDDNGRLIVADRGNRLIQVLSQTGAFLTEFELEHAPESVAATPGGDIFVGDAAGFIVILPAAGGRTLVPPPVGGSGPAFVAVSPDGRELYVGRSATGVVEVMEISSAGESP